MIIDIHAHYVSPELVAEAKRNGPEYGVSITLADNGHEQLVFNHSHEKLRPFFAELCDLPVRVPYLTLNGIDTQVLSTWTDMSGDDLPAKQGARWARLQNETLARDARKSDGRFEAMGTLPMQDIPAAVAELDYLTKHLGMRSLELGTHINGRDLDHEAFRPIWKRIVDYDLLVLLHPPFKPVGLERVGDYFLNNLLSYPADTTIAASRILFSGLLQDLPELKFCLSHGGGFLPYQIGRLDRGFAAHPACRRIISRSPREFLQSFYYDTLTHNTDALDYLNRMVGPRRILYGSDYPFEMLDESGPARVRDLEITPEDLAAILGGNAKSVLQKRVAGSILPPARANA
jgi:aminocarboxymuconate-semialdehyde decarboxylase